MKDYKRLTNRDLVLTLNYNNDFEDDKRRLGYALRLWELEDKIESGEIISTKLEDRGEQEIRFFVKHNYGVRKLFADNLKECLRFHLMCGDITKEAFEIVMRVIRYCLDEVEE